MGAERRFTASLESFFPPGRGVPVPIGDDAAVVDNRGPRSVLACDPVVEGVHFASGDAPGLVGRKAVNRNLSDLAAMGADPDYLLVSLLLPAGMASTRRRALLAGIRRAAREARCTVVGGDTCASPGPLVVTVTAVGHLRGRRLLVRSGARPGDAIHLSGPVGGASLGHHLRFRPHLDEGRWLAGRTEVTAAIDVSDGVALDLETLLRASGGHGAVLEERGFPLTAAARRLGRQTGRGALHHGLGDGEDHVLLFTVRGHLARGGPLGRAARRPVGTVVSEPGLRVRGPRGQRSIRGEGFEHAI